MADEPRTYANKACPYCAVELNPLPKAKKRCPSCGQSIWVRSGPDGLTYLLQEADFPALEAVWQDHHETAERNAIEHRNRFARESYDATISACKEFGVEEVEYLVSDDACAVCRPLAGRYFDWRAAPPLPRAGCRSEFCRCDVTPHFPEDV